MIGHFLLNQQTTATAVVIIIEPVDGAGAGRLLVRTLPIRLYLGCDAPICLPLTTGSIFMTLAVELETGTWRRLSLAWANVTRGRRGLSARWRIPAWAVLGPAHRRA